MTSCTNQPLSRARVPGDHIDANRFFFFSCRSGSTPRSGAAWRVHPLQPEYSGWSLSV